MATQWLPSLSADQVFMGSILHPDGINILVYLGCQAGPDKMRYKLKKKFWKRLQLVIYRSHHPKEGHLIYKNEGASTISSTCLGHGMGI